MRTFHLQLGLCAAAVAGCGGEDDEAASMAVEIGSAGRTVVGAEDSPFAGLRIVVPPGALAAEAVLRVTTAGALAPLPGSAVAVGPAFSLDLDDAELDRPLVVTLPFDTGLVTAESADRRAVKVWRVGPRGWTLTEPTSVGPDRVTIQLDEASVVGAGLE